MTQAPTLPRTSLLREAGLPYFIVAFVARLPFAMMVVGPFIVGVLASWIAPWAPLVGAAILTVLFVGVFALHPSGRYISHERGADGRAPSNASELLRPRLVVVIIGIFGVGLFFGTMLTALTSFMDDRGVPEHAGLLYGVMGIGSAILALGVAWLPPRFTLRRRWLTFSGILLIGSGLLLVVDTPIAMAWVLGFMGIGIGPTLVTQYSFGAARSPLGRSATVMTMLGSAVIVGQSLGAAVTGGIAESFGTTAALLLPVIAAAITLVAGILNWFLSSTRSRTG